jgi:hypothetical protein
MEVRMEQQVLTPGVEYGRDAELGAEVLLVLWDL